MVILYPRCSILTEGWVGIDLQTYRRVKSWFEMDKVILFDWQEVIKQVIFMAEIPKSMAKSVWLCVFLILFQSVIISEMASVDLKENPTELASEGSEPFFSSNTFSGQHPASLQYGANNMPSVNVSNCQYGFITPDALFETDANTWALKHEFGSACLFPIFNLTGVPVQMNLDLMDTLPDPMHFQEDWNFTLSVSAIFSNGAITILDSGYIHQSDFIFSDDSGFISNLVNLNQYTTNWNGYDIGGWRLYTMTAEQILPSGGSTVVEYSFWAQDVPPRGWEDTDVSTGNYPTYFSKPTEDWANYTVVIDHANATYAGNNRSITSNSINSPWSERILRGKNNQTTSWLTYNSKLNLNVTLMDSINSKCFYGSATTNGVVIANITMAISLWDGQIFNPILKESMIFYCTPNSQGWFGGSGNYNMYGARCEQTANLVMLGGGPTPSVSWNNSQSGWSLFTPIYKIELYSTVEAYLDDPSRPGYDSGYYLMQPYEIAVV